MLQQNPEAFGDLSYEIESAYEDQYWISKMNEPGRYRVLAYDGPKVIGSINAKVWDDDSTSG